MDENFAAAEALAACGMTQGDVDRFVCHPGGAKVVTAIERALRLEQGVLTAEREVLRDVGNMSAPTVLFVLDRVLATGQSGSRWRRHDARRRALPRRPRRPAPVGAGAGAPQHCGAAGRRRRAITR
ncbi:3-oxoacyl-[acyl-carrier-protein] synthase III C-terminal domain-containing protein [Pseudoroseicyclus tamaricis]|uniref:3-oxoacyl-[acyl-carrier-protein] synthase III C-terminal domain-containing protein n=1 Tax=Pseudoroseicyclus tamaricis TaxID=2705421 RepID=UPI002E2A6643|nr:3-oxoacyl-[acyl-carrier-protein] synthase III C-terminal domain-containing protein [Pseudoroseicyclus tamaricis]